MYFHVIKFIVNIFRFLVGITEGRPSGHVLGKSESLILTWQNVTRITLIMRNSKQYNHLSYISFKIVPLCNYTLMLATVKVLETFLEAFSSRPSHT
jgi:hypothetical protein